MNEGKQRLCNRAKSFLDVKRRIRKSGKADSALLLLIWCAQRDPEKQSRGWDAQSNGNLRIVYSKGDKKELEKRGARHVSKRSHRHETRRPSRVSTSCQRAFLSSPFFPSHSYGHSNQTASLIRGALVNRITLWKENQFPRGQRGGSKRIAAERFVSTELDLTFPAHYKYLNDAWTKIWWNSGIAEERKIAIDLTNFPRYADVCQCTRGKSVDWFPDLWLNYAWINLIRGN